LNAGSVPVNDFSQLGQHAQYGLAIPMTSLRVAEAPHIGQRGCLATSRGQTLREIFIYLFIYFVFWPYGGGRTTSKGHRVDSATPIPAGLEWPNPPLGQTEVISTTSILSFFFLKIKIKIKNKIIRVCVIRKVAFLPHLGSW
jgi:hypothetical protein